MLTKEDHAKVELILRHRQPELGSLRKELESWTSEHFDYADWRFETDISSELPSRRAKMRVILDKLRDELRERENNRLNQEAADRRHRELLASTKEMKKKQVASMSDKPDLVWAIKHLNVPGWIALVGVCGTFLVFGINLAKVSQVREYFDIQVPPEIRIQNVEVPKYVKVYGGLRPEIQARIDALFQQHEKRMAALESDLFLIERFGSAAGLYRLSSVVPGEMPQTAEQVRVMIAAEQRSFAASLELLDASLVKQDR